MRDLGIRSPSTKVGGVVHFGRMLDKIRVHAEGKLHADYVPNLGRGFDDYCCKLLQVDYQMLKQRVLDGGSDDEILWWAYDQGRRPSEEELYIWNDFMRKRGWNDDISDTLMRRKKEAGMAGRSEIRTMFDFIDIDEGRSIANSATPVHIRVLARV